MDFNKIMTWQDAVDKSELSPLTADLPATAALGDKFVQPNPTGDEISRVWLYVSIVAGNVGGRWAYWAAWKDVNGIPGIGTHPEFKVVADKIFNGDAAHFVGMLGLPYVGKVPGVESNAWVLVEPKMEAPKVTHVIEDKSANGAQRYERSKEVYDVSTGESTLLP